MINYIKGVIFIYYFGGLIIIPTIQLVSTYILLPITAKVIIPTTTKLITKTTEESYILIDKYIIKK